MCLILFTHRIVTGAPLIVAANRDERFDRPAAPAAMWDDHPEILAGRDLVASGTWLGVTTSGRFAAITNFRNPATHRADAPSRGDLVKTFLVGEMSPKTYVERIVPEAAAYNGFCLLVGDGRELFFYSNRAEAPVEIEPGIYGLPNHLLNAPWPKVVKGRAELAKLTQEPFTFDAYLRLLGDTAPAADCDLPKRGRDLERERRHSALRILGTDYGTRCSTVIRFTSDGAIDFAERSFRPDGVAGEVRYNLKMAFPAEPATPGNPLRAIQD